MIEQDLLEGNKYFKWYWSICNRAKDRILSPDIYIEYHHIYPKSIYGQNKDLVKLTAKEHYIVHLLLWRGLRFKYGQSDNYTRKMAYAFHAMNMKNKKQRYNPKNFTLLKNAAIESQIGKKDSKETLLKKSKAQKNKPKDIESVKRRNKSNTGQKRTNDAKIKMSESHIGKFKIKYIIETPDSKIIEIIGRQAVMDLIGCSNSIFKHKKWKKYKLINKIDIL